MIGVPTSKTLLFFKILIQWFGIIAINLYFLETWEFGAISKFAKLVNTLVGTWCLLSKLVAREL